MGELTWFQLRSLRKYTFSLPFFCHEKFISLIRRLYKGCDYPAEPYRWIIRYPAEPVQGVPQDYSLSSRTIPVSMFHRITYYLEEEVISSNVLLMVTQVDSGRESQINSRLKMVFSDFHTVVFRCMKLYCPTSTKQKIRLPVEMWCLCRLHIVRTTNFLNLLTFRRANSGTLRRPSRGRGIFC